MWNAIPALDVEDEGGVAGVGGGGGGGRGKYARLGSKL